MRQCCPKSACQGRRTEGPTKVIGHGWFPVRHGRRRRYRCLGCGGTFSRRSDTAYYRIRCSTRTFDRVALLAIVGIPLIATDGLKFYTHVVRRLFGSVCIYGQVVKSWRKDRVIKVERRPVIGTSRRLEEALERSQDSVRLNTAYIERLNLTLRRSVSYLARRSPGHARCPGRLAHQLELARSHYNFVRPHAGLRFGQETRTPAMVAGLCQRALSFRDIFAPAAANS
jgi:hypothetical protein